MANKKLKVVSCNKLTVTIVHKTSTTPGSNLDQAAATWNSTGRPWLKVDGGWKEDDVQMLRKRLKVSKITDQDHQPSIDLTPVPTHPLSPKSLNEECFQNAACALNLNKGNPINPFVEIAGRRRRRQQSILISCWAGPAFATLCLDLVNRWSYFQCSCLGWKR